MGTEINQMESYKQDILKLLKQYIGESAGVLDLIEQQFTDSEEDKKEIKKIAQKVLGSVLDPEEASKILAKFG